MSPRGRPKGSYRRAQPEGAPVSGQRCRFALHAARSAAARAALRAGSHRGRPAPMPPLAARSVR